MNRLLDITLARCFVTVAQTGSMTEAAARLHLTQGAISQQIKRLEGLLGGALFDRSRKNGLTLNKQGRRLLDPAQRLLDAHDSLWETMTEAAPAGIVRLGLPHDLVESYLPVALEGFAAANPDIEISLVTGSSPELAASREASEIDVALVEEPLGETAGECLSVERLLWAAARGGRAYRMRPLPLSMITDTCAFHEPVDRALRHRSISWRTVFENGFLDTTLASVRADLAITASLACAVPDDLAVLGPESGLPDLPSFAINVYHDRANPAAVELVRHLRDADQRRALKSA